MIPRFFILHQQQRQEAQKLQQWGSVSMSCTESSKQVLRQSNPSAETCEKVCPPWNCLRLWRNHVECV